MLKFNLNLVVLVFLFLASNLFAQNKEKSKVCIPKGRVFRVQTLDNGGPPGSGRRDPNALECCSKLVERNTIDWCDSGMSGAASNTCLACGDSICEKSLENSCNCPEDCIKK